MRGPDIEYSELVPFAKTDRQKEVLDALVQEGIMARAAEKLGLSISAVGGAVASVKRRAINQGYSPQHDMIHTVPDGFGVKGVSTMYDQDGNVRAQWVKTASQGGADQGLADEILDGLLSKIEKIEPRPHGIIPYLRSDLITQYTITDYHIGMYAWHEETGDDWDTDIAERLLLNWFDEAVARAPNSEQCILANLGDFMHWDGIEALTPTSGHVLDADTRIQKLIRVTLRVIRQIIDRLLDKHQVVHVIMAEGNHDLVSSAWLRESLDQFYEMEDRVLVDNNPDPYYGLQFGKVGLFYHHGHKVKADKLDAVLTRKFRNIYGQTEYCYAHVGHLHHDRVLETNLMTVEQHETLAAADAYASRGGWMSGRSAKVIVYHREHGEVERITMTPEMVG